MPLSTRLIKNKIKSVQGIGKITKAMELVAASKMKKAIFQATAVRTYREEARSLLRRLSGGSSDTHHPFQVVRSEGKTLVVIVGATRGLCGGFNTALSREVSLCTKDKDKSFEYITIGRPAERIARALPGRLAASFIDISEQTRREEFRGLFKLIFDGFLSGDYKEVWVASNLFISPLVYKSTITTLLPLQADQDTTTTSSTLDTLFEPSGPEVLDTIIPLLVETILYALILESKAAEHSARMIAMKNASDSAASLGKELSLMYNHARQESITKELSEIISGAEALTVR